MHKLRKTIKAAEARISEISDAATVEAITILSAQGLDHGEFEADGCKFQLQRTDVIDMTDYKRYKGEDAVRWRKKKKSQDQAKKYSAALTKEMKGIVDAFIAENPDWKPDEVKLTLKCLD